jgi:hypothetical protein
LNRPDNARGRAAFLNTDVRDVMLAQRRTDREVVEGRQTFRQN